MKKTAVLGIGNILLRDDGVGVRVVENLQAKGSLPQVVELIDGGTSTIDMLGFFLTCERIIIVDSLAGGHPPGTIYRLTPEQLGTFTKFDVSLHDVQILDLVQMSGMLGKTPEVTIIGIEPEEITESMELSPKIAALLPHLMELVEEAAMVKTTPPHLNV